MYAYPARHARTLTLRYDRYDRSRVVAPVPALVTANKGTIELLIDNFASFASSYISLFLFYLLISQTVVITKFGRNVQCESAAYFCCF